jgi:hypothetical protein
MKVFTFIGFSKHLEELDFDFVVVDRSFNDFTPQLNDKFSDKIIWNETNGKNKWIRIAKQLLKILDEAKKFENENFAIIDSDIIIPNIREIKTDFLINTMCYWLYYSWAEEIRPFCSGTNYIFKYNQIETLERVMNRYIKNEYYLSEPVDIFIHNNIPHINTLKIGTAHYVKTPEGEKKIEFTANDIPQLYKHIPEMVKILW